jgi:hypothetical protein
VFHVDKPVSIVSTEMAPFGQYRNCTRVADAEIRRLIEGE